MRRSYTVPEGIRRIAPRAFEACYSLREIELPASLEYIGTEAFQHSGLERVRIPEGVCVIPERAFFNCLSMREVELPESLAEIGREAFDGTAICEVVIPPHVQAIGRCAFSRAVRRVTFCGKRAEGLGNGFQTNPDSMTLFTPTVPDSRWFDSALRGFMELWQSGTEMPDFYRETYLAAIQRRAKTIWKEPGVLKILLDQKLISARNISWFVEEAAKEQNPEVTAALLEYQRRNFAQKDLERAEAEKRSRALSLTEALKRIWSIQKREDGTLEITSYKGTDSELRIPEQIGTRAVTALGEKMLGKAEFRYAWRISEKRRSVRSVVMGDGINTIADRTFAFCSNLSSIHLSAGLRYIGNEAFSDCEALKCITLPDSVEFLGEYAFKNCHHLEEVRLSSQLKAVKLNVVQNCDNLRRLIIPGPQTVVEYYGTELYGNRHRVVCAPEGSSAQEFSGKMGFRFEALK